MKKELLLLLVLISFLALVKFGIGIVPHFLIIILTAWLSDILFLKAGRVPLFFPLAAFDTGIIIALVLDPLSPLPLKIAAPFLAVFSKHFLKKKEGHIFNPAGFGLFTVALFGAPVSWWVGGLGKIGDLVLIAGMLLILKRLKRLGIVIAFLAVFFLVRLVVFQELSLWFSLLFFPLVMLPEPVTSPRLPKEQLFYAGLAAFFLIFFGFSRLVAADSYLQSLLLVNFLYRFGLTEKLARSVRL